MTGRQRYELADVVRKFGRKFIEQDNASPRQVKALNNIVSCRTAVLGGHEEACDHCGEIHCSYNSCGDRHCPKCQITKQAVWVDNLIHATLPVKHFHIIFTVPHSLNDICIWNARMYYDILFNAAWSTLRSFGYTHYGAETGAIAILHSWGQNLWLHPHIHCIVPAVGYSLKGEWKHLDAYRNFLFPVFQLSDAFKGKFLDSIQRKLRKLNALDGFRNHISKAKASKKWVVFSEASMAGAEHVMRYLGQYTHRVAISNHRILNITDTHVTFIAKDYRDRAQPKPITLEGAEFLRRFCQHVMPDRFVRIRRFGIYNHTVIRNLDLQFRTEAAIAARGIEQKLETKEERIKRLTGFEAGRCPSCKKGRLTVIREIPRNRSPPGNLKEILKYKLL